MHTGLDELVKSHTISDIAKIICTHLQDLSKPCPSNWTESEHAIRATRLSLRDRRFNQSAGADHSGDWFASSVFVSGLKVKSANAANDDAQ